MSNVQLYDQDEHLPGHSPAWPVLQLWLSYFTVTFVLLGFTMKSQQKKARSLFKLGVLGVKIGVAVEIVCLAGSYAAYYSINHSPGKGIV